MSWNDELRGIGIGTLFRFFGKVVVGVGLWYLIATIPVIIIAVIIS